MEGSKGRGTKESLVHLYEAFGEEEESKEGLTGRNSCVFNGMESMRDDIRGEEGLSAERRVLEHEIVEDAYG